MSAGTYYAHLVEGRAYEPLARFAPAHVERVDIELHARGAGWFMTEAALARAFATLMTRALADDEAVDARACRLVLTEDEDDLPQRGVYSWSWPGQVAA